MITIRYHGRHRNPMYFKDYRGGTTMKRDINQKGQMLQHHGSKLKIIVC